ncbi:phage tail protein [Aquamicrobium ahrensii]|uniref:Tip attachment protein J domain-containing protein n=1 Tax=Aquamicrobium ahrensii TaxID=469551 RepID=A0ABV2KQX3_9HYPH
MIFTAIGTAIAGVLFAGSVLAANIIGGVLAFGAQLALSYLNRPKKRTYSAVQGQKEYGARVPVWGLYGTGKVQGHHIYYAKWGKGNAYNADVFVLSNGWCDGLEPEIYFYGKKHALIPRPIIGNEVAHYGVGDFGNLISIRFYDGRPEQGPDTKLVADTANIGQRWKATSVCAGMTYVVVERKYDEQFEHGIPEFEFILRGLRLYDPRQDSTVAGGSGSHRINEPSTWEFSENPALQRLNYQLGLRGQVSGRTLIGEGKSRGQLDLGSYLAAMNACDALRNGKPTYRASLLVTGEDDHTEVLKEFDDAIAGYGMNRRGLSGVIAGAPQIPVMDIGPDDIDAGRAVQIKRRKSAFELYNSIGGQFISREANWNPESLKPVTINADVVADGRMRQTSNDFLQVTDPDIAQYLLQIRYRQNRKGGSATIPVSRRVGFDVEEGNWITYAGLTWLITGWQMDSSLEFTLTLAETGSDVYSTAGIEPGPIVVPPTPPINPSLLTTVAGFDVDAGMITGADGYEKPVLRMTWEPPEDPTITMVRFEYGIEGGTQKFTAETADVESGEFVTGENVVPGEIYIARATIVTVPDRFKTWTGWATTSTATGAMAVTAYLRNVGQDVYQTLQSLRAEQAELRDRLEILAAGTADATGASVERHSVARRFQNATAVALREMTAAISDEDGNLMAVASILDAVQASVGDISADGLRKIEVVAGSGDVVARLVDMVRATIDDDWVEAGTVVEVGFEGGDPLKPFSRQLFLANQFIFTDGSDTARPIVFEDGVAYLDQVRLKQLIADEIEVIGKFDAALILQNGSVIEDLIDVDTFSRFEPIQYSFYHYFPNGSSANDALTNRGTVIVDKPADKPCIEFIDIEVISIRSGTGAVNGRLVLTRNGDGVNPTSGEQVAYAQVTTNQTVKISENRMRGGTLGETTIRYDIWTDWGGALAGSSNGSISIKCDSGVWVFR